jgi:hypothetical protein
MVPSVLSAVAAATTAGSATSSATAAVSAAPKTMSTVAKGVGKGVGKGTGAGLVAVLDQMQSMAGSGTLAPADMPAFKTVAGAVGWTTQLPVPFWNELGEQNEPLCQVHLIKFMPRALLLCANCCYRSYWACLPMAHSSHTASTASSIPHHQYTPPPNIW